MSKKCSCAPPNGFPRTTLLLPNVVTTQTLLDKFRKQKISLQEAEIEGIRPREKGNEALRIRSRNRNVCGETTLNHVLSATFSSTANTQHPNHPSFFPFVGPTSK